MSYKRYFCAFIGNYKRKPAWDKCGIFYEEIPKGCYKKSKCKNAVAYDSDIASGYWGPAAIESWLKKDYGYREDEAKEIKPDEFMTKLKAYINSKINKLVVKM